MSRILEEYADIYKDFIDESQKLYKTLGLGNNTKQIIENIYAQNHEKMVKGLSEIFHANSMENEAKDCRNFIDSKIANSMFWSKSVITSDNLAANRMEMKNFLEEIEDVEYEIKGAIYDMDSLDNNKELVTSLQELIHAFIKSIDVAEKKEVFDLNDRDRVENRVDEQEIQTTTISAIDKNETEMVQLKQYDNIDFNGYSILENGYIDWYKSLSEQDINSFYRYTTQGEHKKINQDFRNRNFDFSNQDGNNMYQALKKAYCPKNLITYRCASMYDLAVASECTMLEKDLQIKHIIRALEGEVNNKPLVVDGKVISIVGKKIYYDTFISTSVEKEMIENNSYGTKNNYRLVIYVPKGTMAAYMPFKEFLTGHGGERELILQAGMVLDIIGVNKVQDTSFFQYEVVTTIAKCSRRPNYINYDWNGLYGRYRVTNLDIIEMKAASEFISESLAHFEEEAIYLKAQDEDRVKLAQTVNKYLGKFVRRQVKGGYKESICEAVSEVIHIPLVNSVLAYKMKNYVASLASDTVEKSMNKAASTVINSSFTKNMHWKNNAKSKLKNIKNLSTVSFEIADFYRERYDNNLQRGYWKSWDEYQKHLSFIRENKKLKFQRYHYIIADYGNPVYATKIERVFFASRLIFYKYYCNDEIDWSEHISKYHGIMLNLFRAGLIAEDEKIKIEPEKANKLVDEIYDSFVQEGIIPDVNISPTEVEENIKLIKNSTI